MRPHSGIGASIRLSDSESARLDALGQELQRPVVRRRHSVVERHEFWPLEETEREAAARAQAAGELRQGRADEHWIDVDEGIPREDAADTFVTDVEVLSLSDPKAEMWISTLCGGDELRCGIDALSRDVVLGQKVRPLPGTAADIKDRPGDRGPK